MSDTIRDNAVLGRFELDVEGGIAFAAYRKADGQLVIFHTEVPIGLRGRGIGSRLVRGVLDQARGRGLKVVPQCSFVAAFIGNNPEYRDVL
jgi:predicted GNAT family acetyltransferase